MVDKLDVIDADTLMSAPLKQTRFIVEGLIPQGMHILCGASKIGKSWLMLWLCLQVAQGKPVWELATEQSDVLYLCLEDTFARIQSRLYTLAEDAPANLRFAVLCGRIGGGLEEQIEAFLADYPATRLIVIDTLQKVRDSRADKNAYSADYAEIGALKQLADRHGIAIVVVHHLRKLADNADPFNQVSGTTGLTGAVDSTYVLKKDSRSGDTAKLLVTGRDLEYQELTLRFENARWELLERKTDAELKTEEIPRFLFLSVNLLADRQEWTGTATELLEAVGDTQTSPVSVAKNLARFYYDVLEPQGIGYRTRRTGKARHLHLFHRDRDDANDADCPQ